MPLGRYGQIQELQHLIVFLLSDACDYLTGQTIAIDGGQHLAGPSTFTDLTALTDEQWRVARSDSTLDTERQGAARARGPNDAKRDEIMIQRSLFGEEHEIWRKTVRRFVENEIVPYHAQWEHNGIVPRELWLKAGEQGLLCCTVPEEYGGLGLDYLFDVVVFEELWRVGASGPGFLIHTDLVATSKTCACPPPTCWARRDGASR